MATDEFQVKLVFEGGELADVQGLGGEYKREVLKDGLPGQNLLSGTIMLHGHGSPGYVIYRTSSGYIRIWKPQ